MTNLWLLWKLLKHLKICNHEKNFIWNISSLDRRSRFIQKKKSPPAHAFEILNIHSLRQKNPKNRKNDFLENFYTKMKFEKMKFYENFREFTKKMIEKNFKKWKCEKWEIERKGDLRKYFEALEKNGLTSSGSILFQNEFFEILEMKTFFSTRRNFRNKKSEKYFSNDE